MTCGSHCHISWNHLENNPKGQMWMVLIVEGLSVSGFGIQGLNVRVSSEILWSWGEISNGSPHSINNLTCYRSIYKHVSMKYQTLLIVSNYLKVIFISTTINIIFNFSGFLEVLVLLFKKIVNRPCLWFPFLTTKCILSRCHNCVVLKIKRKTN